MFPVSTAVKFPKSNAEMYQDKFPNRFALKSLANSAAQFLIKSARTFNVSNANKFPSKFPRDPAKTFPGRSAWRSRRRNASW
jgi:hypothetical protein